MIVYPHKLSARQGSEQKEGLSKEISEQSKEWKGNAASKGDPTPSNKNEDSLKGNKTADRAEAEKIGKKARIGG